MNNSRISSTYRRFSGLCAISISILLLIAGVGNAADTNIPADGQEGKSAKDVNDANLSGEALAKSDGPTVLLSYDSRTAEKNTSSSFLYFVPLVSPTQVDVETSADNNQMVRTVSYERKITAKSFYASSEFEILGKGLYKNTFNPEQIIAICQKDTKKGEPLTNALDSIEFDGVGFGRIEVKGTISDSNLTVTEVAVHFNARGHKSPVTIGLYSIDPENGQYKYEKKYNEIVARVATLSFKRTEGQPRMGVKLVSINKASKPSGYIGRIKGVIANFFINPPVVSKLGNDTMLDFGLALAQKKPSFTFPRANNIRTDKTATTNKQ